MNHTIEYYLSKKGWRIRIIAKNGKIIADGGEAYSTKSNVVRACKRLQSGLSDAKIKMKK